MGRYRAGAVGDEGAGLARLQLTEPWLPAVEDVVGDAGAARFGQELGAEADQAAGRNEVLHPHPAAAVVAHLLEPPLAQRQKLGHGADVLLGNVDRQLLDRLAEDAVNFARYYLRLADRHLEAFAPQLLDEDRQRKFTAALDLPRVRALSREHAQRDVADHLGVEAPKNLAGGQLRAVLAGQRRSVDADRDAEARLINGDQLEWARVGRVGQRLADRHLGDAGNGDDFAGPNLFSFDAVERFGDEEVGHLDVFDRAVALAPGDLLATLDGAVMDAADREAAEVVGGTKVRDLHPQRRLRVEGGGWDRFDQKIKQRFEVFTLRFGV